MSFQSYTYSVFLTFYCRYEFDVTKCMFSAGNITEKLRVAGFDCRGETVVDLYAGSKTVPRISHKWE